MRFIEPDAAVWLLAVPSIWAACLAHRWLRERTRRLSGFGPGAGTLMPLTGLKRDVAFLISATIAAAALVFAAARPQIPIRAPEYESLDLLLLLDRSASMEAEDIRPSRFRRATLEIRNLLKSKPDTIGRVGLIGFAGSSLVLSHATHDTDIVLFYLDWIEEDREPLFGTNLNSALESALDLIRKDASERRKFVVIVSDGEDQNGNLQETIAKFTAQQIPIYSIGIGSRAEVSIPVRNGSGAGTLLNEEGLPMTTVFNESTLRWVAGATGGRYFRSTTGDELAAALAEISGRERKIVRWRNDEYRELYPWGVAVAVAAISAMSMIL